MPKLTHKRHYTCSIPKRELGSDRMPYGFDALGHSIPHYQASITGEQVEGEEVKVWFTQACYGHNNKLSFDELEEWLKALYENVAIVGHTVNLHYDEPVYLTPKELTTERPHLLFS